jgi:hypothetical protein
MQRKKITVFSTKSEEMKKFMAFKMLKIHLMAYFKGFKVRKILKSE